MRMSSYLANMPLRLRGVLTIMALVSMLSVAGIGSAQESDKQPLITSNAIRLNAAGAQRVLATAVQQAESMELQVNISVVDDGGHLIAFLRMDGARPGSIYTSQTKAATAALIRKETGPLPNAEASDTHLSLAVENAATASGGKFTTLKGGVPLVVEGQTIGAVGVGGATGEQDREIARAGATALASTGEN